MKKMLAPKANAASLRPVSACRKVRAYPTLARSMKASTYIRMRNGSSRRRLLEMAEASASGREIVVVIVRSFCCR
ncbi:hypothetical protein D3C72_2277240 [compost metagenome]